MGSKPGGDEFMVRRGSSGGGKIATSNLLRAQRLVWLNV